jgi:hypothetical protein
VVEEGVVLVAVGVVVVLKQRGDQKTEMAAAVVAA